MHNTLVKLKDDNSHHTIPLHIIRKSITMDEKYCWKNWLEISAEKPIVVYDISPEQFQIFGDAAQKTEKTFPDFYKQLTAAQKRELIIATGENHLNSPEITALIAQAYFPKDIWYASIMPCIKKEVMKHYLQDSMIRHNMTTTSLPLNEIFFPSHKTFFCTNGISFDIPDTFNAHTDLYTTSLSAQIKLFNNPNEVLIHMKKKVGAYEYQVTTTVLEAGPVYHICRIKDQQIIKKELSLQGIIITALCSADGKFIVICTNDGTNCTNMLLTLDHESDKIINNEIKLTQNLSGLRNVQFSTISNALLILSNDKNINKSQLLLYDLHNLQEKVMSFDNTETAPTINHDASRMIFYYPDILSVWDISSLLNPILLNTIDTAQLGQETAQYYNEQHKATVSSLFYVPAIHYMNNSNNAVAQLHNGNMLFIDEASPHEINHTVSINPYIYPSSKTILLASLLHTPDNNFLVSHGSLGEQINHQVSYITLWNILSKKMISSHESHLALKQDPNIVMANDSCSFICNIGKERQKLWLKYTLFTAEEKATYEWIDDPKHTLFSLYALHRLYQAHKNKEEIIIDNNNDAFNEFLQTLPQKPYNIHACIAQYLILKHKKSVLETMDMYAQIGMNTCESAFDECKSFFQQLWKQNK